MILLSKVPILHVYATLVLVIVYPTELLYWLLLCQLGTASVMEEDGDSIEKKKQYKKNLSLSQTGKVF